MVVVHNGDEGYRGAIDKFEKAKNDFNERAKDKGILHRDIERWDIGRLTKEIFPYCSILSRTTYLKNKLSQLVESHKVVSSLNPKIINLDIDDNSPKSPSEELLIEIKKDIIRVESDYGSFI
ncbi:MAG: hypothetical protein ACYC49_09385 [Ignavibacteriaceae bacterium]